MEPATTPNRRRGRPAGTGKDDALALQKVAQLMVQNPKMKPGTAIKAIVGVDKESDAHRLNRKWRETGAQHLTVARREALQKNYEAAIRSVHAFGVEAAHFVSRFEQAVKIALAEPKVRAFMEGIREFSNTPLGKALAQRR